MVEGDDAAVVIEEFGDEPVGWILAALDPLRLARCAVEVGACAVVVVVDHEDAARSFVQGGGALAGHGAGGGLGHGVHDSWRDLR